MAPKIFACFVLLCATLCAGSFSFLPVNVHDAETDTDTDGLIFYFTDPAALSAEITVDAIRDGKPVCVTRTIDTDREHGERLVFEVAIDPDQRHVLARIVLRIGGCTYTFEHPRAGVHYDLTPPRRRR